MKRCYCPKCETWKDAQFFPARAITKPGVYCRACQQAYNRARKLIGLIREPKRVWA